MRTTVVIFILLASHKSQVVVFKQEYKILIFLGFQATAMLYKGLLLSYRLLHFQHVFFSFVTQANGAVYVKHFYEVTNMEVIFKDSRFDIALIMAMFKSMLS